MTYRESARPNAVIIRELLGTGGLPYVLYTDFNREGKIAAPDPAALAVAAIESVGRAAPGKDGISYLIGLLAAGIETTLTPRYIEEIVSRTDTLDLDSALRRTQMTMKEAPRDGQG